MKLNLLSANRLSIALFLALTVGVGQAHAADVTYTMSTSTPYLSAAPYTLASMSVPKFNLPGQCLTSVCVSLTTQAYGYLGLENYDNFPKTVYTTFAAQVVLLRPDLTNLLTLTPTMSLVFPLASYDGVVDYNGSSGLTATGLSVTIANAVCLTAAPELALFTGAGVANLPCTAVNTSTQSGANSWTFGVQVAAELSVTYTYLDCTVADEPSTWGGVKSLYR
jgi:hypothetical protein